MDETPTPNEAQWRNWNEISGPKWVRAAAVMEGRLAPVNDLLLSEAAPRPGEQVLEIGCGTGATTLRLAAAVGATGGVLGVDISAPMLALAEKRLAEAGAAQAKLLVADAQIHPFPAATFALALSRFGVMFFADPIAAFRNIAAALAPGGRLVFAAWAGIEANPHWEIPYAIARRHLGPPKPRPPRSPGPLAFSDADYVRDILAAADFEAITVAPVAVTLAGRGAAEEAELATLFGPSGALVEEKRPDDALRATLRDEMAAAFARFPTLPDGGLALPATVMMASARRR
ncbi:MAG: class I SAM-dependent methyltransferase [Acidibrevibacterium sp.]|uniref:class I SAM-dependent methyltransferase n=1 Tax=Acidibrevibacterium sp. TaxID=2606776 RepID=UPI003D08E01C